MLGTLLGLLKRMIPHVDGSAKSTTFQLSDDQPADSSSDPSSPCGDPLCSWCFPPSTPLPLPSLQTHPNAPNTPHRHLHPFHRLRCFLSVSLANMMSHPVLVRHPSVTSGEVSRLLASLIASLPTPSARAFCREPVACFRCGWCGAPWSTQLM